jgi:hypothetical protein
MMMHRKSDRATYIAMEFPRFIHSMILIPCRVMRRARSVAISGSLNGVMGGEGRW